MGRLTVISDHLEGSFDLPAAPWKVGRGKDCDIQLVHKSVSRHHCVITETDGQLRVEDLGSTYGSFINGAQVSDACAGNGDKVKLGRIVLVYETTVAARPQLPTAPVVTAAAPVSAPPAALAKPRLVPNRPPPPQPVATPAPKSPPPQATPTPEPAPKLPPPGPVARFKGSPVEADDEEEDEVAQPARKAAVGGGVYNRLQGGHKRKGKAERPDYEKESEAWEKQADELAEGGGPDYAAEAKDWERVWGKERKRKGGFFFGGGSSGGGLMGVFAGLPVKLRAFVLLGVLIGIGMGGKFGYDQATAHILVPKNIAKKKTLRPTPDNKDAILEKAVESFGKTIPEELREKK